MRKFFIPLMCLALAAAAMPATAATLVFAGSSPSGTSAKIFTAGSGSEAISVRASAWSLNSGTNVITAASLGIHGSAGLGARNAFEGTASQASTNNSHTVDNKSGIDFIILQFDKKVVLGDAKFSAYQQSGNNYTDTDATIGWGNTGTAWNSNLSLANLTALNSLIPNRYASGNNGTQGTNTRNIDPLLYSGNVWIVSSAFGIHNGDGKIDSFKFNNLVYTTKMPVPEPATWIMMIAGFGMVGSAMRRRRALVPTTVPTN